MNSLLRAVSAD